MTLSFIRTGVAVNSISPELGLVLDCPHLKISAFSRLSGINKSLRAPSQDGAQYSVDVCKEPTLKDGWTFITSDATGGSPMRARIPLLKAKLTSRDSPVRAGI